MKLKNSDNNTQVFNRPCVGTWNAECSNGFLAGAEEDGGAETSEFGDEEP